MLLHHSPSIISTTSTGIAGFDTQIVDAPIAQVRERGETVTRWTAVLPDETQRICDIEQQIAVTYIVTMLSELWMQNGYPANEPAAAVYIAKLVYETYGPEYRLQHDMRDPMHAICLGEIRHAFANYAKGYIKHIDLKTYGQPMSAQQTLQLIQAQLDQVRYPYYRRKWQYISAAIMTMVGLFAKLAIVVPDGPAEIIDVVARKTRAQQLKEAMTGAVLHDESRFRQRREELLANIEF